MVGDYFRCSCYARQLSIVVGCDFVLIAECKGISKAGISYKRSVKLSLTSPFLFVPARYDDEGVVDPVSFSQHAADCSSLLRGDGCCWEMFSRCTGARSCGGGPCTFITPGT